MLFILISRFITVKSHGPAVTLQITNRYNGTAYTIDLTLAFKCIDWPREAHEWRMRCRSGKSHFVVVSTGRRNLFLKLEIRVSQKLGGRPIKCQGWKGGELG